MDAKQREALLREVLAAAEIAVACRESECGEASAMTALKRQAHIARQALNGHDVPLGMMPNASGHQWPYILRAVGERLRWAAQDIRTGFRRDPQRAAALHARTVALATEVALLQADASAEEKA